MLPNDPVMLLSVVNTKLRDHYSSLEHLCSDLDVDQTQIVDKLGMINYLYDASRNQFV